MRSARTRKQRRRLVLEGVPESQWKHSKKYKEKPKPKPVIYAKYIKSSKWFKFRAEIFAQRGAGCHDCGHADMNNHLHHLTYDRLGHEKPEDVMILCVDCHGIRHSGGTLWEGLT